MTRRVKVACATITPSGKKVRKGHGASPPGPVKSGNYRNFTPGQREWRHQKSSGAKGTKLRRTSWDVRTVAGRENAPLLPPNCHVPPFGPRGISPPQITPMLRTRGLLREAKNDRLFFTQSRGEAGLSPGPQALPALPSRATKTFISSRSEHNTFCRFSLHGHAFASRATAVI